MTREEQIKQIKIDKQLAIINVCIHAAEAIAKSLKKFPRKKPFGTKGRTPLRRRKRRFPILEIEALAYHSAVQIEMIRQTPIPHYESGTFRNGGIVFGKDEPEYIVMPGDKGYCTPPKLTPLK